MEKFTKLLLLVYLFINLNLYAFDISNKVNFVNGISSVNCKLDNTTYSVESMCNHGILLKTNTNLFLSNIATVPPTVSSPIYVCQNSVAAPLAATASAGGTLNWYGTNATGGTASPTAPTPSTTTVGTISYYVSETVSGIESSRSKIDVNVVADNGAVILGFTCDPSQIAAADKASSVFFDWGNNPLISNTYNYTYTIQGSSPVSSTTSVSHVQVFGMVPGQSATLTLTSATHPCVPAKTLTCTVPCGAATITPNFAAIPAFCSGSVAPILGPTSRNGITGTWSPAIISNTTSGNYIFTPNAVLFPCATTQSLPVSVLPLVTPTFTTIPATVCQNSTASVLPSNSSNATPISGIWSPATVNTAVLGPVTYAFTPNPGQCTALTPTMVSITVVPVVVPNFAAVPPFCSGTTAPLLGSTSPNGIVGTWSPSVISNTTSRSYLFTPNANQCATTQTLNVTVTAKSVPNFAGIPSFCTGTTAPTLATTSPNGITGTWSPAAISNTASSSYVFTPNTTECATTQTLAVTINPLIVPDFTDLSICSGSVAPILRNVSPNGISGTWSPSTINNTTAGSYVFTPNPNQCATNKTINVTVNQSTLVNVVWNVTDAFSENQVVTITATAPGDYLYQLDSGPFQDSPVFEYVALGFHSITVKDRNGCSPPITRSNVLVIDYPKYFTPNNDGFHDTWNIFSLEDQTDFRILIFDRYGKFLKEIRPKSLGWDGMYNGNPMPANDYWFSVEYAEQNISKIFKSHFSLKR
ncbi:T9SS type B sorting domain-containing protein [Flavobacterium xinjiangense]|uniref:Gliding motility-associated C-terminal domain-containing protein n=1 Tax=Flavobacterium xinjiangense TaxID=178356 RepID=A0A1M7P2C8_9FLAO|nr:T9SS type B sorting domain-containing protein [Flavobacterium xinjiangense]SHN10136.1 gliding motility-associated C-terminal domain-containing protein [Flavobacterium xinjiangense]